MIQPLLPREAHIDDIAAIMVVRLAVKQNVLSNPALVTYDDCVDTSRAGAKVG